MARLALSVLVFAGLAAGHQRLVYSADRQPADATLRAILARQKGDLLKVYVKSATGVYINGKQVSLKSLPAIIAKAGIKRASVSADPAVSGQVKANVVAAIRKAGVKEVAVAAVKPENGNPAQLVRKILARQKKKGDELHIYVRDAKRIYVNGTQLSLKTLASVAAKVNVKRAVITAESHVTAGRVMDVQSVVQKAGIKQFQLKTRQPAANTTEQTILKILARQKTKGDVLNVYLKNATGIHVNGTQISLKTLARVVERSKAKRVIITAEPVVPARRMNEVRDVVRKNGVKGVTLKVREAK